MNTTGLIMELIGVIAMVIQMSRSRGNLDMKIDDKYTILEGIQDNKLDYVTVTKSRRDLINIA